MLYILGLGNPGEKYKKTKHNVAWMIFDTIVSGDWSHNKYMNAEIKHDPRGLYIKPQTFMNKSGEVVSFLKKEIDFDPEQLVLLYDDIDLPFGVVRVATNRGDGGHNGVKSVTQHLGSKKTIRIRVGVSRKLEGGRLIKPNVLGNFTPDEEKEIISHIAPHVLSILVSLSTEGLQKTMNFFNA